MSKAKRLVILSDTGNFIEWGPGCFLQANSSPLYSGAGFAVVVSSSTGQLGLRLGEFATEEQAKAVRDLWLQAIIAAPDGGLLRWDSEREQVVDELDDAEESFAEASADLAGAPADATADAEYDPKTQLWAVDDWFMVAQSVPQDSRFLLANGRGPFQVRLVDAAGWVWTYPMPGWKDGWYFLKHQIRPCPAPTKATDGPEGSAS
jgi:hypothetical protein